MEQLKGLPLGRQLILGAGVLLLIDTFLDWQQVSFLGHTRRASAWHGFLGIVMCLALDRPARLDGRRRRSTSNCR